MHLASDLGSVRADPGQIEQVVMNLAVNARDAMPAGGILTIETANVNLGHFEIAGRLELAPGPYVLLSISDTGHGMSAGVQQHLFEPFFTTKEAGKGTGLGLATVYGIVKQSGGDIVVFSEPGFGASFAIYLPRIPLVAPGAGAATNPDDEIVKAGGETVLLVEDEETVRRLTARMLRSLGYVVLEAADPVEALRIGADAERLDLVLSDVVMPDMSGPDCVRRLRGMRDRFAVLFMSGYAGDVAVYQTLIEAGMRLLRKPFTLAGLARAVSAALDEG
jgi:two-component system, cell cycle sensor histidine kinase and response regulator CckA